MNGVKSLLIIISGPAGAGKSYCASKLAEIYGIPHYSIGQLFRKIAMERNLTIEELSKIAEKDPSIDGELDRRTMELAKKGGCIIEGRLVLFFSRSYPNKLSFYLNAPFEERIKRIASREGISLNEAEKRTKMRELSEKIRYKSLYNIDIDDLSVYDFVINTAKWNKEEIILLLKQIIDLYLKLRC
ncbi:MAG: AAA family ATPase [Candidatus Methanomethyliaceae archaeon]|nr:AAA family ATPase [Candidatus Methanomethyliaceae archaeon]MDW7970363.1 AAA family ATPase [Nitrososphaerota archaeon]